jgi:histidinol-phosphatase (PHP family)
MAETCQRAVDLGLAAVAFTEHADWFRGEAAVVDVAGYLECIADCRERFPQLRILSGIELGEPHRHADAAAAILASSEFDRVLASVHTIRFGDRETDASSPGFLEPHVVDAMFREYLRDTLEMLKSDIPFEVVAHLDYPKRYWPAGSAYDESHFEAELRAVLRAGAERDAALELNTTRGGAPERFMCPGPTVVRWWREEGGKRLSFGSDAHSPEHLAAGFELAGEVAEAAGFRPQPDPTGFWLA